RNEKLTRGKSESLIAPQSSILLLLEGLLFTQNFMGCPRGVVPVACKAAWYNALFLKFLTVRFFNPVEIFNY
ncbi:hypothetical protein ACTQ3L_06820, partial [Oscillospiraceae bacterium LCP25S3_E4]